MATDLLNDTVQADVTEESHGFSEQATSALGPTIVAILRPLASLKLTVALLAMSIFIVLAGTMAQVDKDIWQVVDEYFRCPVAWIDLQIFFPPSFFPNKPNIPDWMVIPFPGGWLIGAAMFLNLAAAHGLRFKPHTFAESALGRWITLDAGDIDGDGDEDLLLGAYIKGPTPVPAKLMAAWEQFRRPLLLLENSVKSLPAGKP